MNEDDEAELLRLLEEERLYQERNRIQSLYPDTGPLRRGLYAKHLAFFRAGAERDQNGEPFNERCVMGANRSGKTLACSYEHTCHLTGWYPTWWEGFRFNRAIVGWAAGEDSKSVRESLQAMFLGSPGSFGTGLVPHGNLIQISPRAGVPDAIDSVTIRSAFGGNSRLLFKSYDQGRESFQAAHVDVMQFDEEPPADIYSEGLTRTMSTIPGEPNGLVIAGFTPLHGLSSVVLAYMPGGQQLDGAVRG